MTDTPNDPFVVDCIGQSCPMPIIELAKAMASVPVGGTIVLLSDDAAAASDIPAWCRMRGHELASADPPAYTVVRVS